MALKGSSRKIIVITLLGFFIISGILLQITPAQGAISVSLNWTYDMSNTPIAADINQDGYMEILIADDDGTLYCLDYQKNVLWTKDLGTGSDIMSRVTVADIDADKEIEIVKEDDQGLTISFSLSDIIVEKVEDPSGEIYQKIGIDGGGPT